MKKKKGFTIAELIAVIVLLAVIITIAAISIVDIKDNTLKTERNNLISTIKIAAKEYHEETGINLVPVLVLLQTGRIESDEIAKADIGDNVKKGDPVLYDPVNKEVLNCGCVNFKDNSDGKWDTKTNCCSPEILSQTVEIEFLYPKLTSEPKIYDSTSEGKWYAMGNGEKFVLRGTIKQSGGKEVTYTWISPSAPDTAVNDITFDVMIPELGYIMGEYVVTANFDGHYAEKSFNLKLDGKLPFIENLYLEDADIWTSSKTLHADLKDYESGLYGFYIKRNDGACSKKASDYKTKALIDSNEVDVRGNNEFNLNVAINENGFLSVCVRDESGNIFESDEKIDVTHIDKTSPRLKVGVVNGTEYLQTNTVNVELTDPGSEDVRSGLPNETYEVKYAWSTSSVNCSNVSNNNIITLTDSDGDGVFKGSASITGFTGKGKVYVCPKDTITDLAGNKVANESGNVITNTPINTNMYLDNTAPTIGSLTVTSNNTNYHDKTVTVKLKNLNDSDSGLKAVCLTTSNDPSGCTWKSNKATLYTYSDVNTGLKVGDGGSITYYGYVKDAAGNVSQFAKKSYTVYEFCDSIDTDYGKWSTCSKKCGKGTHERSVTYTDEYFANHSCGSDTEKDYCNDFECCSKTYEKEDTNDCSVDCDGGKYYVRYYSSYDDSYCSGSYSGSKCNTQSCKDICDYSSADLFGTSSGSISGNAGERFYVGTSYGTNWCDAADCNPQPGTAHYAENRICVTSNCGKYYGWTARAINNEKHCGFSSVWCQCSWG